MNANELADILEKGEQGERYTGKDMKNAAIMLRQQQAEIDKVNSEWVQAAMALGACVQENHSLKAEIELLKAENKSLIAELEEWEDDHEQ